MKTHDKSAAILSNEYRLYVAGHVRLDHAFATYAPRVFVFSLPTEESDPPVNKRDLGLAIITSLHESYNTFDSKEFDNLSRLAAEKLEVIDPWEIENQFDQLTILLLDNSQVEITPLRRVSWGVAEFIKENAATNLPLDADILADEVLRMLEDRSKFLPIARPLNSSPMKETLCDEKFSAGSRVTDAFGNLGTVISVDEYANHGLGLVVTRLDDGRVVRSSLFANGLTRIKSR